MHTVALNADYQVTEKLNVNAGFTYNYADDSWDWDFTERTSVKAFNNGAVLANNQSNKPGMYAAQNYDNSQLNNEIDGYSDLSYEQYSFTLGATYDFTDALYTTVSGTYDVFNSDEDYVYGDEDGKAYSGSLAVGYKF